MVTLITITQHDPELVLERSVIMSTDGDVIVSKIKKFVRDLDLDVSKFAYDASEEEEGVLIVKFEVESEKFTAECVYLSVL